MWGSLRYQHCLHCSLEKLKLTMWCQWLGPRKGTEASLLMTCRLPPNGMVLLWSEVSNSWAFSVGSGLGSFHPVSPCLGSTAEHVHSDRILSFKACLCAVQGFPRPRNFPLLNKHTHISTFWCSWLFPQTPISSSRFAFLRSDRHCQYRLRALSSFSCVLPECFYVLLSKNLEAWAFSIYHGAPYVTIFLPPFTCLLH